MMLVRQGGVYLYLCRVSFVFPSCFLRVSFDCTRTIIEAASVIIEAASVATEGNKKQVRAEYEGNKENAHFLQYEER